MIAPAGPSPIASTPGAELRLDVGDGVTLLLVQIPAGPFLMGSDRSKDRRADEQEFPLRTVHLDDYWIGKYPVTNEEYRAFVRATGRKAPSHWRRGNIPKDKERHPVVNVTWYDAVAFCDWLTGRLSATQYFAHLPTEAEWEKAARGTDGRIFPWGDMWDSSRCNGGPILFGGTTPVGKYSPQGDSPYGLADVAGNVWEWCATKWTETEAGSAIDADDDEYGGVSRAVRGGSWYHVEWDVRCALRGWEEPDARYDHLGFRCACSVPPPL